MEQYILRVRRKRSAAALSAVVVEPPSKRTNTEDSSRTVFKYIRSGTVDEPLSTLPAHHSATTTASNVPLPTSKSECSPAELIRTASKREPLFIPGTGYVVDVEFKSTSDTPVPEAYEYDYYVYSQNYNDIEETNMGFLSLEPFGFDNEDEYQDDDSDSNAEDHYGNDYPDEESMGMPDYDHVFECEDSECLTSEEDDVLSDSSIDDDGFDQDWI
ncbi:hypothetical protein P9112_009877 [Eukaryota sp. TZLM1-RC]